MPKTENEKRNYAEAMAEELLMNLEREGVPLGYVLDEIRRTHCTNCGGEVTERGQCWSCYDSVLE